ncbi:hypothetical protein KM043_005715 [Ampulex compressa]|nr:hypothetical protein KM043_005715 [Ampulex compressa]
MPSGSQSRARRFEGGMREAKEDEERPRPRYAPGERSLDLRVAKGDDEKRTARREVTLAELHVCLAQPGPSPLTVLLAFAHAVARPAASALLAMAFFTSDQTTFYPPPGLSLSPLRVSGGGLLVIGDC